MKVKVNTPQKCILYLLKKKNEEKTNVELNKQKSDL